MAKVRAKVEVVDEAGGSWRRWRRRRTGRWVWEAVRDESRGWKRGDSGSQRVKAAPSGRSMCVASLRFSSPSGTNAECRAKNDAFHAHVLIKFARFI